MSDDLLQQGHFALDLLEAAPDAIVTVDVEGTIVFVNSEAESLFGYSRDDLLGAGIELLIPHGSRVNHRRHREGYHEAPRKRPMGAELDLWGLTRSGKKIPVEISLSPHETDEGFFVSAAIRDVTRRKETEAALLEARNEAEQANQAKTRFLAAASHDLRQPLQAGILYANVLQRQIDEGPGGETVGKLQRSLEALQSLLNRLLDVSRLDAQAIKPETMSFSMQLMLERLVEELAPAAEEKGIELRARREEAWVYTDPQLLERLLRNLITNAIRYTERGGVLLGCRRRGGMLKIQVWDTGIGIPEEDQERIFDEFFQVDNPARRRQAGLGLGLAIVHRLARLLEHPVTFRSVEGRGSVFEVTVPISGASRARAEAVPAEAAEPPSRRLLVLDDDPDVLDSLSEVLTADGHLVAAAPDLATAFERIEEMGQLDGLVCDYRLGGEVDGIDAILALRRRLGAEVPAVLLTGDSSRTLIEEAQAAGLPVLFKPVQVDEVKSALFEDRG